MLRRGREGGMGGTKSGGTLDRGSTIYGGLAGTYLAFVIGRTRGSRLFQDAALRNQG